MGKDNIFWQIPDVRGGCSETFILLKESEALLWKRSVKVMESRVFLFFCTYATQNALHFCVFLNLCCLTSMMTCMLRFMFLQTWNLSKILHRRNFRLKLLHRQFQLISTVWVIKTQKMSENGEIYTAGKNFTLQPAVKALTNSTSMFLCSCFESVVLIVRRAIGNKTDLVLAWTGWEKQKGERNNLPPSKNWIGDKD